MPQPILAHQINRPIPEWKLKLSYFYVAHQAVIKRALIFLLFFINIIIVFLFGGLFLNYQTGLIADQKMLSLLPKDLVNYEEYKKTHQPIGLKFDPVAVVPVGDNNYDIIAAAVNNNINWAVVSLTYTFTVNGADLAPRSTFILPKSRKYLIYFNAADVSSASIKIIKADWRRVTDFSLLSYQNSVKITDSLFQRSSSSQTSGEVNLTVFNDSPYSFWEVGLPVILRDRGDKIIGDNYIVIQRLMAKEERAVKIGWPDQLSAPAGAVEIIPEINLLDDNAIIKPAAPPGSPPGRE